MKPSIQTISITAFSVFAILIAPLANSETKNMKGTFAVVSDSGVIPVADNSVISVPCAPINAKCQEIQDSLTNSLNEIETLSESGFQEINTQIKDILLELNRTEEIKTNLQGEVSNNCPTQNCLIYTYAKIKDKNYFWINIQESKTEQEYPPSRAIIYSNEVASEEIVNLVESVQNLSASFKAGISYQNFSNKYSPFINALNQVNNGSNNKYSQIINKANQAEVMLDVLQDTWRAYIESASVSGFGGSTHEVSCDFARSLRDRWNNTLPRFSTARIGEIKGGLLGCLFVDIGKFKSPYGTIPWHQYMLNETAKVLNEIPNLSQLKEEIPEFSIPKQPSPSDYIVEGKSYIEEGKFNQALEQFNRVLVIEPNNADAYYYRGNAYFQQGKFNQALENYNRAITLAPNRANAYYNRAQIQINLGKSESAIQDLEKATYLFDQQGETDNYEQALQLLNQLR